MRGEEVKFNNENKLRILKIPGKLGVRATYPSLESELVYTVLQQDSPAMLRLQAPHSTEVLTPNERKLFDENFSSISICLPRLF
jgi:hypothetical protein